MPATLRITDPPAAHSAFEHAAAALDDVLRRIERARTAGDAVALLPHYANGMLAVVPAAHTLLAALACGRAGTLRTLLRLAAAAARTSTPTGLEPLLPLLAARFHAWTGDPGPAAALLPSLADALIGDAAPAPADAVHGLVRAAALAGVERMATDLGDAATAARLHRAGREIAAARPAGGRLDPADAVLAAALDHAPAGVMATAAAADPAVLPSPALQVLHAVHVLVGAAPDAPRHRLWLRPRLPAGAQRLAMRGLALGEDGVAFEVRREGSGLVATVAQEVGPIPLTLLLELRVPEEPTGTTVDGQPAALTVSAGDGAWTVAVQLVLDHERTVGVDGAGA